jgi:hypothetical protein
MTICDISSLIELNVPQEYQPVPLVSFRRHLQSVHFPN